MAYAYDNEKHLKVGDHTFAVSGSSYHSYTPAIVVKITPKGYIDLKLGGSEKIVRFRPDGSGLNESRYYGYRIDSLTYDERLAEQGKEDRLKAAASLIKEVVITDCKACYGKKSMQSMICQLETRLKQAREAVEAI